MTLDAPYQGGCLCGAVRFEVLAFESKAAHCHCSMCRRFHGSAFSTFAGVPHDKFTWLSGVSSVKEYRSENGTVRTFCSECGSSLGFKSGHSPNALLEVALGAMDGDVPVTPDAHIYLDHGANWYQPEDDLPKYPEGRDSTELVTK